VYDRRQPICIRSGDRRQIFGASHDAVPETSTFEAKCPDPASSAGEALAGLVAVGPSLALLAENDEARAVPRRQSWREILATASGSTISSFGLDQDAAIRAHGEARVRAGSRRPWPARSTRQSLGRLCGRPSDIERLFDGDFVERIHRHFDIGQIDAGAVGLDPDFERCTSTTRLTGTRTLHRATPGERDIRSPLCGKTLDWARGSGALAGVKRQGASCLRQRIPVLPGNGGGGGRRRGVEEPRRKAARCGRFEQGRQRQPRENAANMREPGDMALFAEHGVEELKQYPCADEHPGWAWIGKIPATESKDGSNGMQQQKRRADAGNSSRGADQRA